KASWTISCAASMSRTIRSTEATTRACSIRKTSARRVRTLSSGVGGPTNRDGTPSRVHAGGAPAGSPSRRRVAPLSHRPDRSHLDETALAQRDLLRPFHRFLLGIALDQVEAAQGLLGLGEGPVHELALPGLEADAAAVTIGAQALAVDHLAGCPELLGEAAVSLHDGLHVGLGRGELVLVGADEQQIAHRSASCQNGSGRRTDSHLYDADGPPESTPGSGWPARPRLRRLRLQGLPHRQGHGWVAEH